MEKVIVFYHKSDMDGKCSAAICEYFLGSRYETALFGIDYGDQFPWELLHRYNNVYMVDFSLPVLDMMKLNSITNLIWIDHHITAIQDAERHNFNPKGLREVGVGACELTWRFLGPQQVIPKAVSLLSKYDVWNLEPDVLEFQTGLISREPEPQNQYVWEDLFYVDIADSFILDIIKDGETILRYLKIRNKNYIKEFGYETRFADNRLSFACNTGLANSQMFTSVPNKARYDLLIPYVQLPNGKWRISLYTEKDNIHVGEIAKLWGGGGHARAAGFIWDSIPWEHPS